MIDRKKDLAWLEARLREIRRKQRNTIYRLPPDECSCGRGPKRAETEMCQHCEDDAQANIIDSDEMQAHRIYAGDKR